MNMKFVKMPRSELVLQKGEMYILIRLRLNRKNRGVICQRLFR